MEPKPLIVIVGPTASGKTALAIRIAERFNGEIICADSRTVYKYMDIGTAKPTSEERRRVPHWGLDIAEPDESYTASMFQAYARDKVKDIRQRGKVPILVGGSGLYVDSVVFNYSFGDKADPEQRAELDALSVPQLQAYCKVHGIELPENSLNKRYLIRSIERGGAQPVRRSEPKETTYVYGIARDKDELRSRIELRSEGIFAGGIIEEAAWLGRKYGWDHESMKGNIYPLCRLYLESMLSLEDMKAKFIVQDWRLAKRQMTWFRRNKYIVWGTVEELETRISSLLASE